MTVSRRDGSLLAPGIRRPLRTGATAAAALCVAAIMVGCGGEVESALADGDEADVAGDRQVILVTGSTDGLGREVARQLAAAGAHVIVHGRNRERGEAVVREIEEDGVGGARFYAADFASLDQVRELADAILRDYDRLDVLVNNAGIGRGADQTLREVSEDGHELRFQVNYLSSYLLTRKLLPLVVGSAPSRIVNVASLAQTPLDFDDVMLERGYDGSRAYGQSKLAQILFTVDLAEELEGSGVTVTTLHPATMMPTTMVLERGGQPMSTLDEGVEAVLHLVTEPGLESGQFFNGLRPARANDQAYDAEARRLLRELSRELTGE
jgi:NAD(P)-dependent dehydrogenase (short-subunit alcohol dehydrogenase family)